MSDSKKTDAHRKQQPPKPVDVVDDIPDRTPRRPLWRYILLAVVFMAWVAFLIYVAAAGSPKPH